MDLQRLFAPIRSTRSVLVAMMSVDPLATYVVVVFLVDAAVGGIPT